MDDITFPAANPLSVDVALVQASFQLEELAHFDAKDLRAEREVKMTMTECNTEMQSFPQQVIVGILVPAGQMGQVGQVGQVGPACQMGQMSGQMGMGQVAPQVATFPYQAMAAPAIYAKPEYVYMPQMAQLAPLPADGSSSFPVTPRSPQRQASPEALRVNCWGRWCDEQLKERSTKIGKYDRPKGRWETGPEGIGLTRKQLISWPSWFCGIHPLSPCGGKICSP